MNPLEYMQALAALWGRSGAAMLGGQQSLWLETAERMANAAGEKGAGLPQGYFGQVEKLTSTGQAFSKLWSSAIEVSAAMTQALQRSDRPDPILIAVLGRIFDPRLWFAAAGGMEDALNRLAEGPRLADLWQVERKFLHVFNAWATLRKCSLEHNTVMLEAWMRAAGAFAKILNRKADQGEALESWRDVLALWVETANAALLESQRSEPYLKTQRAMLNASSELRLAQQEVAEFYNEMFGYPTRTELDDVHKSLTQLRREMRALKIAVRAGEAGQRGAGQTRATQQAPAKAFSPRRSRAAKSRGA